MYFCVGIDMVDGDATYWHKILHDGRYRSRLRTGFLPFGGNPKLPQNRKFCLRICQMVS